MRGHGDEVHLAFRHEGGGASSAMLALTAPAAAEHTSMRFWGPAGIAEAPPGEPDSATDALMRAVSELLAAVQTGAAHGATSISRGRSSSVLADAEHFLSR